MNIILEPTLPVGETLETRANKFKSWGIMGERGHGYYYRPETIVNAYETDAKKSAKYDYGEWNGSAILCGKMRDANRNSVVRDTGPKKIDDSNLSKRKSVAMDTYINFFDWKQFNEEQYLEQFQLAYSSVADDEGKVSVKDARKIILDVMGDDVPPFVMDKFATLCWRVAKYGNITWENFYNLIFKASNIIRADCSTKREMPPLVQLMNKPRMHDKALGPFTATNSIYSDTFKLITPDLVDNTMTFTRTNSMTSENPILATVSASKLLMNPSTKQLSAGSSKSCYQVPGYSGHIPRNTRNTRKVDHSDGTYEHPVVNDLMLTQRGMGTVLGYSGYVPKPSLHVKFNERRTGMDCITTTGAAFGPDRRML